MRKLLALAAVGVMFSGLTVMAAEGKKITIEGDGMCAKCALHESDTCQNVVVVTKDGKHTTYYIHHDAVAKKAHGSMGFCKASKEHPAKVKVVGVCKKEDDKLVITAEKIEKDTE